jgi:lipopolysaccharide heptosyltransferase II
MVSPDPNKPSFWKAVSDFAGFTAYRLGETVARLLPVRMCFRLGKLLGMGAWLVLPGYRRLARRNVRIAFGGEWDDRQIRRLVRSHFSLLGANLLCSLKIPHMSAAALAQCVEMEGLEKARECIRGGHGVMYALLHMGNWEVLAHLPEFGAGGGAATLFQRLGNSRLNAHVEKLRSRQGCRLFDRRDGFHAPVQWLRQANALGVLVDQHAGDAGVWAPFFRRLASTTTLTQLLALRSGARIFPVGMFTVGVARWKFVVAGALPVSGSAENGAAELNLAAEAVIRQSPADWFWVHNRWKTPKPQFLLRQCKRGVALPSDFPMDRLQPFEILVRSTNWLGDACMAIPAIRAMRRGRPDARITILTPQKLADLWRAVPEVDAVLEIPPKAGVLAVRKIVARAGRRFDAAVLLPNSLRSALEVARNGIPRIVGYRGHWRSKLLHQIIPPPKTPGPVRHHSQHYLAMALRLGADVKDPTLADPLLPPAPASEIGPLRLGICPGAEYGPAKRWPVERFADAAAQISESSGAHWAIFGAAGDVPIAAELASRLQHRCDNLAGKTSLRQLMEELRRCRLLLTNDTGTMHLATALGVPTVAIFGSTDPGWTGPLGAGHVVIRRHVECSPCFLRDCPLDFRCMREIQPADVAAVVLARLAGSAAADAASAAQQESATASAFQAPGPRSSS